MPKEKTEAQRARANATHWAYDKAHTTRVFIKLNNATDADILEHLAKQDNKQGYIKKIIREDIAKQKEE